MPWSSPSRGGASIRRSAPILFLSLKNLLVSRALLAGGVVWFFALLAARVLDSSPEPLSVAHAGLGNAPHLFSTFSFSAPPDTDLVRNDTLQQQDSLQQSSRDTIPSSTQDTIPKAPPKQDSLQAPAAQPDTLPPQPSPPDTLEEEEADTTEAEEEPVDEEQVEEDTTNVEEGAPQLEDDVLTDSLVAARRALAGDTTKTDSSYVVFLDSTWRMQQHRHHRADNAGVDVFPRYSSSLYLDASSPAFKREIVMDSLGQFVTITEQVNGLDIKVPVTLSLEEYVRQRIEYERLNNWRTMTYAYNLSDRNDGLGSLFGSFTNIEIPVPANPIFSIFGKNKISLRITGTVDIRAGFRNITSDIQTLKIGRA
ncbi:MAG: hypothetical protein EPO24_13375, partial [Bacteroidetes bacterium]